MASNLIKAIVVVQTTKALQLTEVHKPVPLPRDLLVKVRAIGVNPVDVAERKMNLFLPPSDNRIVGWDASGVVEAVGNEVKHFKVGDEVYFAGSVLRNGSYAEYVVVDERITALKPKNLSHQQAAALPLCTITAWELFEEHFHLDPKQHNKSILIIGGAGGVGSIAIQIAKKAYNLKVIATASRPETIEFCKKLGADFVINHSKDLHTELKSVGFEGVDYIFCTAPPNATINQWASILNPLGHAGVILTPSQPIDLSAWFRKRLSLSFEMMFTRPINNLEPEKQGHILARLSALVEKGEIQTTLTETLDWKDAEKAHASIESGKTIGKIVLTPS